MNRKRVYIAGPITKGVLADNVNQATRAFVALAKAGLAPLCPHWSVYANDTCRPCEVGNLTYSGGVVCIGTANGNDEMTHKDWLGVDLAWVAVSDALLRLPGESKGADAEEFEATRWGIPVFHSVDEVIRWASSSA